MDNGFEKKICYSFFAPKSSERLFHELSSKKKRPRFLDKMCHTAQWYLADCIFKKSDKLPSKEEITGFLNDDSCYFISTYPNTDGGYFDTSDTLDKLWSNGSAYIAVSRDLQRAYLETEYDISCHTAFFLKIKNNMDNSSEG